MKSKIIRSVCTLIWAVVSIVQFVHHDITMGIIYAAVAALFFITIFKNKNKQN